MKEFRIKKKTIVTSQNTFSENFITIIASKQYQRVLSKHKSDKKTELIYLISSFNSSALADAINYFFLLRNQKFYIEPISELAFSKRAIRATDLIWIFSIQTKSISTSDVGVTSNLKTLFTSQTPNLPAQIYHFQVGESSTAITSSLANHPSQRISFDSFFYEYGQAHVLSLKNYLLSNFPFDFRYTTQFASYCVNSFLNITGRGIKCMVTDFDGVLWKGEVGESNDVKHFFNAQHKLSPGYFQFQRFLLSCRNRGLILIGCTKNNLATAREALRHNNPIKEKHFAYISTGHIDKFQAIKSVARKLKITENQILFVDNSSFEKLQMKRNAVDIIVPSITNDPIENLKIIEETMLSDDIPISREDKIRNKMLRLNFQRAPQFSNHKAKAQRLQIPYKLSTIESNNFHLGHWERAYQLLNKCNQFNLNGKKIVNLKALQQLCTSGYKIRMFRLIDEIGDHGYISVVLYKLEPKIKSMLVEYWVLSCRVFSRDVEKKIFTDLGQIINRRKFDTLTFNYLKTDKNWVVQNFFKNRKHLFKRDKKGLLFANSKLIKKI